jgi:AAA15 family ATPase/GTPase
MQNVFEADEKAALKTLKTAVIFGPNASGKSNILLALGKLIEYIVDKPRYVDSISLYEPFLFDLETKEQPSEFELEFIGPDAVRYIYNLKVISRAVLFEQLDYFKGNIRKHLLIREEEIEGAIVQKGYLIGDRNKKTEISVFSNQLLLSKFGTDEPHDTISPIFKYFTSYEILLNRSDTQEQRKLRSLNSFLFENPSIMGKVVALIKAADTKIDNLEIVNNSTPEATGQEGILQSITPGRENYQVFSYHTIYSNGQKTDAAQFMNFRQESKGSQMLYLIGGLVLMAIDRGGVLIIDELNMSLHPFITKLILMIFQSEKLNKRNAQLIFTSHDLSVMDRDLLRKDQIWIASKNDPGESELYSLQDFDNLREDTPFEKWYIAGKFDGLPHIQSVEHIFDGLDED